MFTGSVRRRSVPYPAVAVVLLALPVLNVLQAGTAKANADHSTVKVTRLSTDPYTNASAEHATEVEPDIWAHGRTLVADFQVGRIATGSADNIGWATSTDGGSTWSHGFMSGITVSAGGKWARASDPVVAYDPKAKVWLASALNNNEAKTQYGVSVNQSANGLTWQKAVQIATSTTGVTYDKPWVTCDATPASPHYGNCYAEWDLPSSNDLVVMSTSTNGGLTWSKPSSPAGQPTAWAASPWRSPTARSSCRSTPTPAPSTRSAPPTVAHHGLTASRWLPRACTPTPAASAPWPCRPRRKTLTSMIHASAGRGVRVPADRL